MSGLERPGRDVDAYDRDDLDDYIDERSSDPKFRAAYEDAIVRSNLLRAMVAARRGNGASQGEVASAMGTTQSAVSDLERGSTDPRISTLQRYARAISCRLHVMLSGLASENSAGAVRVHYSTAWPAAGFVVRIVARHDHVDSDFWAPILACVERVGRPRWTPLVGPADTHVAPIEMRTEPDEFMMAAVR